MENQSNIRPLTDLEKMTWYVNFLRQQIIEYKNELYKSEETLSKLQEKDNQKIK